MLQELKNRNKKCFIVTAKLEDTARKILEYFKIDIYFELIVGATADGTRTKKTEVMKFAIDSINDYKSNKSIMIGDRPSDIKAGIANNMDTIGVLYGMDTKENLENAGAKYLVEDPIEIVDIIK